MGVEVDATPSASDLSPAERGAPVRLNRRGRLAVAAAAVVCVALAGTWALVAAGSGVGEVTRYLGLWLLLIIVPGVLLWRAVAGHSTTEIELGAGSVLGIALFLISWGFATAAGHPGLTATVPVGVLVAFLVVPSLRRHWRPWRVRRSGTRRTPPYWWIGMAVCAGLAIYKAWLKILQPSPLPPGPSALASDTWYCLGIAQQLLNGFPVADPTYAGGEIKYHWFSLGVITGTSQLARTDLTATLLHLWFVPFLVIWVLLISAVVRSLLEPYERGSVSARWWGWGPIAAALAVVFPAAFVLNDLGAAPALGEGLNSGSASGAFGGLFVAGLCVPVMGLLRGTARRGTWVLLVVMVIAGAGMKPTVLPLVAAGCGVVAGLCLLRRERGWRTPAVIAGLCLAVFAVAGRVVVGSTGGVKIQPFAILAADSGYPLLFRPGPKPLPGAGGFVLPAIAEHRPGALLFVLTVTVLFLLGQLVRLLGILVLARSAMRKDRAAWWVGGVVVAGYGVTFLLCHSGLSQQWFALNASGVAVALTIAVLAMAWPDRPSRSSLAFAAVTFGLGVAAGVWAPRLGPDPIGSNLTTTLTDRILPYAAAIAVLAALVIISRVGRKAVAVGSTRMNGIAVASLFLVAASLPASTLWFRDGTPVPITSNPAAVITKDQQSAALWINEHSGPDDVVVSNVFCRPVPYREVCDRHAVWVSALTGRRLVLDGWIYTPQSAQQYDATTSVSRLPSPFPDRLALSLKVIRQPSRETVCRAVTQYQARWIYADRTATRVASSLRKFADERYVNSSVSVYQIRDTAADCVAG